MTKQQQQRFLDRSPEESAQLELALERIAFTIDQLSAKDDVPHDIACEAAMIAGCARYLNLHGTDQTRAWFDRHRGRVLSTVALFDPSDLLQ